MVSNIFLVFPLVFLGFGTVALQTVAQFFVFSPLCQIGALLHAMQNCMQSSEEKKQVGFFFFFVLESFKFFFILTSLRFNSSPSLVAFMYIYNMFTLLRPYCLYFIFSLPSIFCLWPHCRKEKFVNDPLSFSLKGRSCNTFFPRFLSGTFMDK